MITRRASLGKKTILQLLIAACLCPLFIASSPARADEPAVQQPSMFHRAAAKSKSCYARCKTWVKSAFVTEEDLEIYGLTIDDNWRTKEVDRDLVVLIHGFNSTSDKNEALMNTVREAGYPCATFNYPNDDEIDKAAKLLSQELLAFAARYPERRVTLLTHSAGGLVARACVEDWTLDPGTVDKLILIAPPNHGSVLARLAVGMDFCEHAPMLGRGGLKASIVDGMCEMREDLQPRSEFLTRLNEHGINKKVSYTILLGTGARVSQREMDFGRYVMRKSTNQLPASVKRCVAHYDEKLAQLDEVITGKGDGAVAICKGRLDGVKDTVLIDFEHLSVTGPPETSAIREVHEVVLDRLSR